MGNNDPTYLTLAELSTRRLFDESSVKEPLKSEVLAVIDTVSTLRRLALDRFEIIKQLKSELEKLKEGKDQ